MSRSRKTLPRYLAHSSGKGRAVWNGSTGRREKILSGDFVMVYHGLKTMAPLRRGHCEARESEPRQPADPAHVAAALPFLKPHVRAIVELLRCTGMRPGEVCRMTMEQIDRTGSLWTYCPTLHKNEHRGQHRTISLGATAQAIIHAHLDGRAICEKEPLFSPRRQRDERSVELRAKRKSKVQPSQVNRRVETPKRPPGERFTSMALGKAVESACEKAGVPGWTPYQLRHLKGAELREKFSLEHVRAALGHSHASIFEAADDARDGLDIRLGTDRDPRAPGHLTHAPKADYPRPKANPKGPGVGDMRVLIAPGPKGKPPVVTAYRPVWPEAKAEEAYTFESPVKKQTFESVTAVPDVQVGVKATKSGYIVEPTFTPESGREEMHSRSTTC